MPPRTTHTLATLEVEAHIYDRIASLFKERDQEHRFLDEYGGRPPMLDMNGIGLIRIDPAIALKKLDAKVEQALRRGEEAEMDGDV